MLQWQYYKAVQIEEKKKNSFLLIVLICKWKYVKTKQFDWVFYGLKEAANQFSIQWTTMQNPYQRAQNRLWLTLEVESLKNATVNIVEIEGEAGILQPGLLNV